MESEVHERSGEAGDCLCYGRSGSVVQVARPEGKHFPQRIRQNGRVTGEMVAFFAFTISRYKRAGKWSAGRAAKCAKMATN